MPSSTQAQVKPAFPQSSPQNGITLVADTRPVSGISYPQKLDGIDSVSPGLGMLSCADGWKSEHQREAGVLGARFNIHCMQVLDAAAAKSAVTPKGVPDGYGTLMSMWEKLGGRYGYGETYEGGKELLNLTLRTIRSKPEATTMALRFEYSDGSKEEMPIPAGTAYVAGYTVWAQSMIDGKVAPQPASKSVNEVVALADKCFDKKQFGKVPLGVCLAAGKEQALLAGIQSYGQVGELTPPFSPADNRTAAAGGLPAAQKR